VGIYYMSGWPVKIKKFFLHVNKNLLWTGFQMVFWSTATIFILQLNGHGYEYNSYPGVSLTFAVSNRKEIYVRMYTYDVCTYINIHTYTCAYIHTCLRVYTHIHVLCEACKLKPVRGAAVHLTW
jgi:hypothetical protein